MAAYRAWESRIAPRHSNAAARVGARRPDGHRVGGERSEDAPRRTSKRSPCRRAHRRKRAIGFGPRARGWAHSCTPTLGGVALDADRRRVGRSSAVQAGCWAPRRKRQRGGTSRRDGAGAVLLVRARAAAAQDGRCRREVPLTYTAADGTIVEGVADLAFEEAGQVVGGGREDRHRDRPRWSRTLQATSRVVCCGYRTRDVQAGDGGVAAGVGLKQS